MVDVIDELIESTSKTLENLNSLNNTKSISTPDLSVPQDYCIQRFSTPKILKPPGTVFFNYKLPTGNRFSHKVDEGSDKGSLVNCSDSTLSSPKETKEQPKNMERKEPINVTNKIAYMPSKNFSGNETEDVLEYIDQFNLIADTNNWSQLHRRQHLPAFLTNAAANWYRSYRRENPCSSYEELTTALSDAFPTCNRNGLERMLWNNVQGTTNHILTISTILNCV